MNLPSHDETVVPYQNGTANPLEIFIHNNEPAGREDERQFRSELVAMLNLVVESGRHDSKLVFENNED